MFYDKIWEIDKLMEETNTPLHPSPLIRSDDIEHMPSHDIKISIGGQEGTLSPNLNREKQIVETIRRQDEVSLSAIAKIKGLIGECNQRQLENVNFIIEQVAESIDDTIDLTAWDVVETMRVIKENLYILIKKLEN